ncbi:MAG: hypothetical protein ACTSQE_16360 [Candidatus Heimdallarchaeaceae archaeon]
MKNEFLPFKHFDAIESHLTDKLEENLDSTIMYKNNYTSMISSTQFSSPIIEATTKKLGEKRFF